MRAVVIVTDGAQHKPPRVRFRNQATRATITTAPYAIRSCENTSLPTTGSSDSTGRVNCGRLSMVFPISGAPTRPDRPVPKIVRARPVAT